MDKVALVTGASRGIGKEIAIRLGALGYHVYAHYWMNEVLMNEVVNDFKEKGYKITAVSANLGCLDEVKEMFEHLSLSGNRLDVLVNNAASGVHKKILDVREKDWDWTMNINAKGTFFCSQYAARIMKMNRDNTKHIINIISTGAGRYIPGYALIGGSKAYIENLTKYMAYELANDGILVNAISGGLVQTDALNAFYNKKLVVDEFLRKCPQKKMIEATEIADVVEMLVSDCASRICGQTITVDGGVSLC